MKALGEMMAVILFWCFVAGLFFVFYGEPDLWDVWHAMAMGACKP